MSSANNDTWEKYRPSLMPTPGLPDPYLGMPRVAYSDDPDIVQVTTKDSSDESRVSAI